MSDLSKRIPTRRQFMRWMLVSGITTATFALNTSKAQSKNSVKAVKVPPLPATDDNLDLGFNPMSILRDFD